MDEDMTTGAVVVGIDANAGPRAALAWAADTASRQRRPLVLARAYSPQVEPSAAMWVVPDATLRAEAAMLVDGAADTLAELGWAGAPAGRVVTGGPVTSVLNRAASRAHVLVVGRRSRNRFTDLVIGSNAYRVVETSSLPVVVVPDQWDASERARSPVVVGFDGSAAGERAVAFAYETADRHQVPLHAVEVVPPFDEFRWEPSDRHSHDAWLDSWRRAAAEVLAGWRERFPDVEVHTTVEEGHPVDRLVEHARQAQLLVVGGTGHGRISRILLGSVSRGVLHHATSPVAVVHEADPTTPA